jgi:cytochrome c oxidase assembly protein subunit 11
VLYTFRNSQPKVMRAQAIPSYAPKVSAGYFRKIECFCFNEYTLAPGEAKQWPVAFVVDPNLPKDVNTITLSYTFFEVGTPFVQPSSAKSPSAAQDGGRA